MNYGAQTTEGPNHAARVLVLGAELRLLRTRSDLLGSSASVHALRNSIATAQGALGLVQLYHEHGMHGDAEALLDIAERRLRDVRQLLAGGRHATIARRRGALRRAR